MNNAIMQPAPLAICESRAGLLAKARQETLDAAICGGYCELAGVSSAIIREGSESCASSLIANQIGRAASRR